MTDPRNSLSSIPSPTPPDTVTLPGAAVAEGGIGSATLPEPPVQPLSSVLQRRWQEAQRAQAEGDFIGARHLYQSLIDFPQLSGGCFRELGRIALAQGDAQRAQVLWRAAIRLESRDWVAYALLSAQLTGPEKLAVWMAWGVSLTQAREHAQAAERFAAIVQEEPRSYTAWINFAQVQMKVHKDHPDAWRGFWQSVRLAARSAPEVAALLQSIEPALRTRLDPPADLPPGASIGVEQIEKALTSLGYVCSQCHLLHEGIACQRLALRYHPGLAVAHWNLSLSLLLDDASWTEGWGEYEWRWHWPECPEPPRHLPVPMWRGEDLQGKRLLVWTEQGYGDALQFVALLPRLQALGAELILETTPPLRRLFAQSFPDIPIVLRPDHPNQLSTDQPLDYAVPLLSLPQRLHLQAEDRPLAVHYLRADPADQERWRQRLAHLEDSRPKVGLVWAGNSHNAGFDFARSLFHVPDIHWFSLQLGAEQQNLAAADLPQVTDLSAELKDFAETAAVITQLDLVISIDSAVAHLAAGLDQPVWVLVSPKPNWRWPGTGKACPWYPTARLFRRTRQDDGWEALQAPVKKALRRWQKTRR